MACALRRYGVTDSGVVFGPTLTTLCDQPFQGEKTTSSKVRKILKEQCFGGPYGCTCNF
ncbi:MAG: hypothetical protein P8X89_11210 [Reinekea sp.]